MRFTKCGAAAPFSFIRRRFRTRTTRKKRGGAGFDSHEPSSPKVTCIGQVRVKSKKRVRQCRRRIGEVSFRSHGGGGSLLVEEKDKVWIRSQRLSSSSVHSHREQRWVHLPDSVLEALRAFRNEICCFLPCGCSCFSGERRRRRKETEREVYGNENGCGAVLARWLGAADGGDDAKRTEIEVVVGGGGGDDEMVSIRSSRRHVFEDILVNEDDEEGRVSICIPPKNALLLMRCRSDPMKMASLASRFSLDLRKIENEEDEDEHEHEGKSDFSLFESEESNHEIDAEDSDCKEDEIEENESELMEKVAESDISSSGSVSEHENSQNVSESAESDEKLVREKDEEETEPLERETPIQQEQSIEPETEISQNQLIDSKSSSLPECLLLMMCEPKLSMEVSKETWVRGTDFIRLLPERPRKPAQTAARRPSICKPRATAPPRSRNDQLPARSSCSLPAATVVEVKSEPFELTRCKSEPVSTAAAKLLPEPHKDGGGAAGVGF